MLRGIMELKCPNHTAVVLESNLTSEYKCETIDNNSNEEKYEPSISADLQLIAFFLGLFN